MKEKALDTSHILGQSFNKGKPSINKLTVDEILIDGVARGRGHLKWALEQLGVSYVCAECGLEPAWNGKELVIPIDHISGDRLDNRKENLRFLCPNCHTQTETWGNKNKRRYKKNMVP